MQTARPEEISGAEMKERLIAMALIIKMFDDVKTFIPKTYFAYEWGIFKEHIGKYDLASLNKYIRFKALLETMRNMISIVLNVLYAYEGLPLLNLEEFAMKLEYATLPDYFAVVATDDASLKFMGQMNFLVDKACLLEVIKQAKKDKNLSELIAEASKFLQQLNERISKTSSLITNVRSKQMNEEELLDQYLESAKFLGMNMEKVNELKKYLAEEKNPDLRKERFCKFLENYSNFAECHNNIMKSLNSEREPFITLRDLHKTSALPPDGFNIFKRELLSSMTIINEDTGWLDENSLAKRIQIYFSHSHSQEWQENTINWLNTAKRQANATIIQADDKNRLAALQSQEHLAFTAYLNSKKELDFIKTRILRNQLFDAAGIRSLPQAIPAPVPPSHHSMLPPPPPLPAHLAFITPPPGLPAPSGPTYSLSNEQIEQLNQDLIDNNERAVKEAAHQAHVEHYNDKLQITQKLIVETGLLVQKLTEQLNSLSEYGIKTRKKFEKTKNSILDTAWRIDELVIADADYSEDAMANVDETYELANDLFLKASADLKKVGEELAYLKTETKTQEANFIKKAQKTERRQKQQAEEAERLRLQQIEEEKREAEELAEQLREEEEQRRLEALELERIEKERLEQEKLKEQKRQERIRMKEMERKRLEAVKAEEIEQARLARVAEGARQALEAMNLIPAKQSEVKLQKRSKKPLTYRRRTTDLTAQNQWEQQRLAEAENARKQAEDLARQKAEDASLLAAEQARQAEQDRLRQIEEAEFKARVTQAQKQMADELEKARVEQQALSQVIAAQAQLLEAERQRLAAFHAARLNQLMGQAPLRLEQPHANHRYQVLSPVSDRQTFSTPSPTGIPHTSLQRTHSAPVSDPQTPSSSPSHSSSPFAFFLNISLHGVVESKPAPRQHSDMVVKEPSLEWMAQGLRRQQ